MLGDWVGWEAQECQVKAAKVCQQVRERSYSIPSSGQSSLPLMDVPRCGGHSLVTTELLLCRHSLCRGKAVGRCVQARRPWDRPGLKGVQGSVKCCSRPSTFRDLPACALLTLSKSW